MAKPLNEVTLRESEFFDREYETHDTTGVSRFHAANEPMHDAFIELLLEWGKDKNVLEIGCGRDPFARMLHEQGAHITAIDISSTAIEKSREENSDLTNITYHTMNAEQLEFPDGRFDLVFGAGILHHIDLAKSLHEIIRVLKPGGRFLFAEPLGMNPVLKAYRKLTPSLHTSDEHPLMRRDLLLIGSVISDLQIRYFSLLSPIVVLLPQRLHRQAFAVMRKVDDALMKLPLLRYWSWVALFAGRKEGISSPGAK